MPEYNPCLLPHYRDRTEHVKYIIIHCSQGTPKQQLKTLDKLGLSIHFIIGRSGKVIKVLPLKKVAYHAGASSWYTNQGPSLNGCSIGIELESSNLGQTKNSYSDKQITALCNCLTKLKHRYHIRPENILAHSDVSPDRKPDPGAGFPWKRLAENNLSYWPKNNLRYPETDEKKLLSYIGYNTANLAAARCAFCRHWLPEEIKVVRNIKTLVEHPYDENLTPKDPKRYLTRLQKVARATQLSRLNKA